MLSTTEATAEAAFKRSFPGNDRTFKGAFKAYKGLKGDILASIKKHGLDIVDSLDTTCWNSLENVDLSRSLEVEEFGLISFDQWEAKKIPSCPGGIILRNPFTKNGQRKLIRQTLTDFPVREDLPSNLDRHWEFAERRNVLDWWSSPNAADNQQPAKRRKHELKTNESRRSLVTSPIWKLRWVTLGYHHDWDSKVYSEDKKTPFPADLEKLCRLIVARLGFPNFSAQAAIVNYYHLDSTLSPHQDVSEPFQEAPLISISFGQPAVFLIGAKKTNWPTAVLLRSGDVFLMTNESRLFFHGVPKVFYDNKLDLSGDGSETDNLIDAYLEKSRININVRQVLRPGQTSLPESDIGLVP